MKGIPFINHLYVPEIHPLTQTGFCEREDEGHVLKVTRIFQVKLCLMGYSIVQEVINLHMNLYSYLFKA